MFSYYIFDSEILVVKLKEGISFSKVKGKIVELMKKEMLSMALVKTTDGATHEITNDSMLDYKELMESTPYARSNHSRKSREIAKQNID